MRKTFVSLIKTFLLIAALNAPASAEELPKPTGPVLLTVRGDISVTNNGETAEFDRDMLFALGATELTTSTIWTEGPQTFTGVTLKALAERLDIRGNQLQAVAVNDYAVDIPFSDAEDDAALLAIDRNGQPMKVRDKGPIWLIFPFDQDRKYRSEVYHSRSVWQLVAINVLP
ncbi:hypothetical protein GGQ68_003366 [Sagittula marina]|uniref:Oxidoreductase molybdopterin-binding domain-containing protein n=1 Tax=Sagittula marina TaxID=943940 RepID=A0A7W6DQC6_9RHOB|nr:hypothetical protein [Sagittula marina]